MTGYQKLKKRVAELEIDRNILLDQIDILVLNPDSIEALPIKMAVQAKKAQGHLLLNGTSVVISPLSLLA